MTAPETDGVPEDVTGSGVFARCGRCSRQVRRSEMDMHLAYIHNIGPSTGKKDKNRNGRRKPRRFDDE